MTKFESTPLGDIPKIVADMRASFNKGITRDLKWRRAQLLALHRLLMENETAIRKALREDMNKPEFEADFSEIGLACSEVTHCADNLQEWTSPEPVSTAELPFKMDKIQLRKDPLGVVLIIAPWNYPIQLVMCPLAGAIAAGNCVVMKPSELSPATSMLIAELVPKYLDQRCFRVINGAVEETTKVLEERFDHILYTGNSFVAKIVMTAAAKFLTPVVLELGGKSPAIVDSNTDMDNTARRILWGKCLNAGQSCIAPDYVIALPGVQDRFVESCRKALKEFYGGDVQSNPDFGRLINDRHWKRVKDLMDKSGKIAVGGASDAKERYIEPTVLVDVSVDDPIMQEEIFGPVLPVVNMNSLDDAIAYINANEKPLAAYVFSKEDSVGERVLSETSSGGVCVNDTMMHGAVPELPFGGVGNSGTGAYHGKRTFDMYCHKKAALIRSNGMESMNNVRYAPYTSAKSTIMRMAGLKSPANPVKAFIIKTAITAAVLAMVASRLTW